jgi:hypothetical protein
MRSHFLTLACSWATCSWSPDVPPDFFGFIQVFFRSREDLEEIFGTEP